MVVLIVISYDRAKTKNCNFLHSDGRLSQAQSHIQYNPVALLTCKLTIHQLHWYLYHHGKTNGGWVVPVTPSLFSQPDYPAVKEVIC